jgi:hypothetical protein
MLKRMVRFEFVKLVPVDAQGKEELNANPVLAYTVQNDQRKEFGYRSFSGSDSYTLEYDVYQQIRRHHPAFIPDIEACQGFYLSGRWQAVNELGDLVRPE